MREDLPTAMTIEVRDRCVCLHLQRAARAIARRLDEAFRPFGLTNGQFSLLMVLNRPSPPRMGDVAQLPAMDRTTLTANLEPLERRGLLAVRIDPEDKRGRRLELTKEGRLLLTMVLPVWRQIQAEIDGKLACLDPNGLRASLQALS
ncbi:MarR family transcriptional regulator [Geminicoccaceae bacterium 1502E]|nr:MarR family transcriptional regulator [Geminicoccaceae bacterium 1502E]